MGFWTAKQQKAPAHLHVIDSEMRGRDAQSWLSLPRFRPSLQQSSVEICPAPVKVQPKVCLCEGTVSSFTPCTVRGAFSYLALSGLSQWGEPLPTLSQQEIGLQMERCCLGNLSHVLANLQAGELKCYKDCFVPFRKLRRK